VKTILSCTLLVLLCIAAPTCALAQSNAKPDYKHQHKQAQIYQKSLLKQRKKAENAQMKQIKRDRKKAANR